jgi:hypothetical protein
METELAGNLLRLAAAYSAAKRLSEGTVGRLSASDTRFFSRIRGGKTFTAKKYDEVVHWFAARWPDDAPWPDDVIRPKVAA